MRTATSIMVQLGKRTVPCQFWTGQRLQSSSSLPMALDVETALIEDERRMPCLALAVASDGRTHVAIHPSRLAAFLEQHREAHFVGHNVQFDFWVIDEHLKHHGDPAARRVLWDACHSGRLRDTMILDMLVQLATGNYRRAGRSPGGEEETAKVYPGNLAEVVADYTTVQVCKEDPYRTRFGELVGLAEEAWPGVDPGFFRYAVLDAAATHRLYPALAEVAYRLMQECGYRPGARRYEIRPDAIQEFGYLSEIVQVRASIVLARMFRQGVHVDQEKVRALTQRSREELNRLIEALRRDFSEVLTYSKGQTLRLTPKGQTPSLTDAKLLPMLTRVAGEIEAQGHEITVPQSKGTKRGISKSVKDWQKYADLHPFLRLWANMKRLEKLFGFLTSLDVPVLHCEYTLMTRTGRTACSRSRRSKLPGANLQQMPKQAEFRELFIPAGPDQRLFIGDYSAIELRTLAAVCRARYGASKLGEVIEQGIDPHAFTAASIQNLSLEDFLEVKETDKPSFNQARQSAKAVNFGVPGGLGAKRLREYAEANYGVAMTMEEATKFRSKLIHEVYPELNDHEGYLADPGMPCLAKNLGLGEDEVWQIFDRSGKRNPIAAKGVANVIRGVSTASEHYQQSVWQGLSRLVRGSLGVDPHLAERISRKQGGQDLYDRLYHQKIATLTGRIRDGVGYTDSKNTPFQSLAADGAKLALWNLLYHGYDVYGFVHDEILVNIPAERANEEAVRIEKIMLDSMAAVLGGIPAECKWVVSDCWAKPD